MNNKPTTKLLSMLLALLMIMSSLTTVFVTVASAEDATAAAETATVNTAYNLLQGIDFEDVTATTADGISEYLNKQVGIHMTSSQSSSTPYGALKIATLPNGNKVLHLASGASFINGNVGNAKNADKLAKSQNFLDLLFSEIGPASFSLSLDLIFLDNDSTSGNIGNVNATSDDPRTSLTSYYRGSSAFSFTSYNGANTPFKVVSANLPVYTLTEKDGKDYVSVAENAEIPEELKDVGYFYNTSTGITHYAENPNDPSGTDTTPYWNFGTNNPCGTGACIPLSAMTENPFMYKIGEPVTVRFDFTRSGTTMTLNTYIRGYDPSTGTQETDFRSIATNSYSLGTEATWKFGLRLFDQPSRASLDNIKIDVNPVVTDGKNYEVEVINTPNDFAVKYFTHYTEEAKKASRNALVATEYGIDSTIANVIEDITVGNTLALNAPENGSYWVAFDVNTPKGYTAATSALLSVGESALVAVDAESGKLELGDGTDIGEALTELNTYQVAVKVESGKYTVYLNGTYAGVVSGALSGDISLNAEGVNLRNVKAMDRVIEWPAALNDLIYSAPKYASAPCVSHTAKDGTYKMYAIPMNDGNGGNNGVWSYICSSCGIRVYVDQGVELMASSTSTFDGDWTSANPNAATIAYDANTGFSATAGKYYVSFTVSVTAWAGLSGKGLGGGNFLNMTGSYSSALRFYTITDSDGDTNTLDSITVGDKTITNEQEIIDYLLANGKLGTDFGLKQADAQAKNKNVNAKYYLVADKLDDKNNASSIKPLFIMKAGETYSVTIEGNMSVTNGNKVYVNGKLVKTGLSRKVTPFNGFRLTDGNYGLEVSDFTLVEKVNEPAHVCTGEYSTDFVAVATDTAVDYSYTCYCGKVVDNVISKVVKDNIPYITTPTTVDYVAPAGEYWIAADVAVDADQSGTLITLGDTAIVDTDDVKNNATVVVSVSGNKYTLYVEGVKTASDTFSGNNSVTFGTEGVSAKFAYAKIVELDTIATPVVPVVHGAECVHEGDSAATRTVVCVANEPLYKYVCTKCNTFAYKYFPYSVSDSVDFKTTSSSAYQYRPLFSDDYYNLMAQNAMFSTELTVDALPTNYGTGGKSLLTWVKRTVDNGSDYYQWIRIWDDATTDEPQAVMKMITSGGWIEITDFRLVVGETYKIVVVFDIAHNTYDMYINGKFCGSASIAMNSGASFDEYAQYNLRLGDAGSGCYTAKDFKINVSHVHTPKTDAPNSVNLTSVALLVENTCAVCGEDYTDFVNKAIVNNIATVADGYETVAFTAPTGEYWLTTEINMRKQTSGTLLTLGSDVILTTDDVAITAPDTVQVAVRVNGTSCTVYLDGEAGEEITLTAVPTSVTYGDKDFGAYVRYNNNRIVNSGVITSGNLAKVADDTKYGDCTHSHSVGDKEAVKSITTYSSEYSVVSYKCEKCGELVHAPLTDSLIDWHNIKNEFKPAAQYKKSGMSFVYVEDGSLSSGGNPYWIKFDLSVTSALASGIKAGQDKDGLQITKDNYKDVATSGSSVTDTRPYKGYGFITVQPYNTVYESQLRLIPDGWEVSDGAVYDETTDVFTKGNKPDGYHGVYVYNGGSYRNAKCIARIKAGSKVSFALYIDPSSGDYDVYVDGKWVYTETSTHNFDASTNPAIRIFESGVSGHTLDNFVISYEAVNYKNRVLVVEAPAKFKPSTTVTEAGTYEPLIHVTRTRLNDGRSTDPTINFLYVDVATGQLAYKNGENYVPFVDKTGGPITLGTEAKDVTVIYDHDANSLRYYVGGYIPYYAVSEGVYATIDEVVLTDTTLKGSSVRSDSIGVRATSINLNEIKSYTVNKSGTAEILGYQTNDYTGSVRVVSGVDMPWYSSIGYSVNVIGTDGTTDITILPEGADSYDVEGINIFHSLIADDKDIFADKYGYSYFSALTINPAAGKTLTPGCKIVITPFTKVGEVTLKGVTQTIEILENGYRFVE